MSARPQPLVVGAGPAGVRAAQALVRAGLRPLVVDEAASCGGQIYRQRPVPDGRPAAALYGSEAGKAARLHAAFAALDGAVDYWPQALVWNLAEGVADIAAAGETRPVPYDGLVLATGATDRILPVPGWTLPGVFTLGGAQVALKAQGCAIGRRVVFAGSGPLLYLVAWQYRRAGIAVAAVLDASPPAARRHLLRAAVQAPGLVARGLRYAAALRLRGTALRSGVTGLRFTGDGRVSGVAWREGRREHGLACEGVGYGLGLRAETQLAELAGCALRFDARDRAVLPVRGAGGRGSVPGTYLAGDGAGIAGADAAERAGERAALALLEDRGLPVDPLRAQELDREIAAFDRLRDSLERAFPFPAHWAADIADRTVLCRCEEVDAGTVRAALRDFDLVEVNRAKAVTRVGMGRCQGRVCGAALAEIVATATGQDIATVGRLRAQAPVKPLPLGLAPAGALAAAAE